jgi:hypothetical protein
MGPKHRRLVLLAGLIAILLVIVVAQTREPPPTGSGGGLSNPTVPRGQAAIGADTEQAEIVNLEALEAPHPEPVDGARNPFRFGERRVTPPASANAVRPPSPAEPTPTILTAPSAPPGPPPIALKFIGLVEAPTHGGKLAVLSDGRSVFHGYEGAIVDGRYRIVRIGVESIEMTYADGRGRQTIRLTGQ